MHPDTMYQIAKIRHTEDLRRTEAARLAELARGNQTSRAAELLNNVVAFAKRVGANSIEAAAPTADMPQIGLGGDQA